MHFTPLGWGCYVIVGKIAVLYMQIFHHSIFHTERYCRTVFQLAAFFCMSMLLGFIRQYLPNSPQLVQSMAVVLAIGTGWNGLLLFLWTLGYCDCGQNPGPMFLIKLSRVTIVLWASSLWLLCHFIAVKIAFDHKLFDHASDLIILACIFFSMGLPFFIIVVNGWAQKIQSDITLVTSVDINAANLNNRSKEDLEYLLQLAKDLDEEINATVIARHISGK